MKKIMKTIVPVLAVAALVLFSCKKKGGHSGLLIHKDAIFAVHINGASLSGKLSWEEIRQTKWFERLNEEADDSLASQLLANPESSGIDIKSDMVMYARKAGKRNVYFTALFKLKDSKAFGEFVNKMLASQKNEGPVPELKTEGDYSWLLAGDQMAALWNKSQLAVVGASDSPDFGSPGEDEDFKSFRDQQAGAVTSDSLKKYAKEAIELSPKNNLDGDSRFAAVLKDPGDMHIWVNQEMAGNSIPREMSLMINTDMLVKGNAGGFTLNFENGQIKAKSRNYFSKELTKLLKKYKSENVDEALLNRIPSQNVIGALALNYKPELIKDFVKSSGVEGLLNLVMAKAGLSVDEFVKANKGDVLLAATDLSMKVDSLSEEQEPDVKFTFATSVGDQKSFENFMAALQRETKNGSPEEMKEIMYKLDKNWFVAGNSQEHVDKFMAGTGSSFPYAAQMKGHPMAGFIDFQKIFPVAIKEVKDSSALKILNEAVKTWQDAVATGGEWDGDGMISNASINLVDKNTNSLKQLNRFMDFAAVVAMEERSKNFGHVEGAENMRFTPPVILEEKKTEAPKAKTKR